MENSEYPTDDLVPMLVRIQRLATRLYDTFSYEEVAHSDIQGEFATSLTVDAFMRDLHNLRLSVDSKFHQNGEYCIIQIL
jgi:hypothetical protein